MIVPRFDDNWINEDEVAWLAGLYEGEGHVYAKNRNGTFRRGQVSIYSNDRDVLERVHDILQSGTVYTVPPRKGRQQSYQWYICRRDQIADFYALVEPWLGQRRLAQFQRVLEQMEMATT